MAWFADQRQLWIAETLRIFGFINREHLVRKFGVSVPQASIDLREFQACETGNLKVATLQQEGTISSQKAPEGSPPSAGPFEIRETENSVFIVGPLDRGCREPIAQLTSYNRKANALHIVKTLTVHDDLIDALEELLSAEPRMNSYQSTVDKAEAVLARAKGS